MTSTYASEHDIRRAFFEAMSLMYRTEVPLYGDLLDIVADINTAVLTDDPEFAEHLKRHGEYERLGQERHGAIRVGTANELAILRRAFAVMGMHPVGYYDLSVAGVPVHSTAFRPVTLEGLHKNPFRVFTSLLRLELIDDDELRRTAAALLGARSIMSPRAIALIEHFESSGGLSHEDAEEFVAEVLETFRWHSKTVVDSDTYHRLHEVHRLIADVTCFTGPHINHLTPRTLDIDAAQAEMGRRGMEAKDVIEGPPRRNAPILLRQTSFKALEEAVRFSDTPDGEHGKHTARFGEIEQRGLALTHKGRALYDALLDEARGEMGSQGSDYEDRLNAAFEKFPDDYDTIRKEGLGFFRYLLVADPNSVPRDATLEEMISQGLIEVTPIVYEDFLPVSAAGVFQSNLGGTEQRSYSAAEALAEFERALGAAVSDPFELYAAIEQSSREEIHVLLARR